MLTNISLINNVTGLPTIYCVETFIVYTALIGYIIFVIYVLNLYDY